jgi:hypothetical protein
MVSLDAPMDQRWAISLHPNASRQLGSASACLSFPGIHSSIRRRKLNTNTSESGNYDMGQRKSRLVPPTAQSPPFTRIIKPPEPDVLATVKPNDTLSLRIQTASLHELLEMRRVAAKHGAHIHTLRISMGSISFMPHLHPRTPGPWIELDGSLQYVDYRPIDWDALLALLPSVRCLDLSEMPLTSLHVRKILEAAAKWCNELEALVLPTKTPKRGVKHELEHLLRALFEAAKRWRAREERPGLMELTVPCYARSDHAFSSGELFGFVLDECPRLTALDVTLCHTDWIHDAEGSGDTVDDAFCMMLTRSCSHLARFTLRDVFSDRPTTTIQTLTDGGLLALGRLASLSDLQLRSANIIGLRLFEFLSGLPSERCGSRLFQITIGGPKSTERLLEAFRVLMERLETTSRSDLRFATSDFLLRINNGNLKSINEAWSRQYLSMAEPLVERVKAKHPSLRIRLTMSGLYEHKFDQAHHFWLYTTHSTHKPPERDWDWGFDSDPHNSFANIGGRRRNSLS